MYTNWNLLNSKGTINLKKYKIAAALMIIHALMELSGCIAAMPIIFAPSVSTDFGKYFSFIVPYLQENLTLMLIMGGLFGAIRMIDAVGILKNRM
jgi:hypothetical protein